MARDAASGYLDLTIAASEAMTPICTLHDMQFPVPSGWWDTLDRLGGLTSLLGGTSAYAIICNWSPVSLVAGVEGSILDLSEVFTNTAGTTPATWGESVARVNDVSPNARHAVQASAALRPLLGRAPAGGRRNLLTQSENMATTWNPQGVVVAEVTGAQLAPASGPERIWSLTETDTLDGHRVRATGLSITSGQTYTVSIYAKAAGSNLLTVTFFETGSAWTGAGQFDLSSGAVLSGAAAQIADAGNGWYRCSVTTTATASSVVGTLIFGLASAGTYQGDPANSILLTGQQLVLGAQATPYQRVGISLDVTQPGFPSPAFLRFDLSDDVMPTVFPDGGTFDVLIAGRKGSWIERDVTIAAGGSLNIGPSRITGGPEGLLAALGDIAGVTIVDRTMTAEDVTRLVQYYRARGAKGLLVPGPELLANGTFDTGLDGWAVTVGTQTYDAENQRMVLTKDGSGGSVRSGAAIGAITAGKPYLFSMDTGGVGIFAFRLAQTASGTDIGQIPGVTRGVIVATASVATGFGAAVGSSTLDQQRWFDNISVRELRPEEDW